MELIVVEVMLFVVLKVVLYKVIVFCIVLFEVLKRIIFLLFFCDGILVLLYFSESVVETVSWYLVGVSVMMYVDMLRILVFDVYYKEFFIEVDDVICVNVDVMVVSVGIEFSMKVTFDVSLSLTSILLVYFIILFVLIFSENVNGNEIVICFEFVVVENLYELVLSELLVLS